MNDLSNIVATLSSKYGNVNSRDNPAGGVSYECEIGNGVLLSILIDSSGNSKLRVTKYLDSAENLKEVIQSLNEVNESLNGGL